MAEDMPGAGTSQGPDRPADGVPPRLRDMALLLPLAGFLLTMPPLVMIFSRDALILGTPLLYLYLFTLWCALIVGGALLARRLCRAEGGGADDATAAEGPPERSPDAR